MKPKLIVLLVIYTLTGSNYLQTSRAQLIESHSYPTNHVHKPPDYHQQDASKSPPNSKRNPKSHPSADYNNGANSKENFATFDDKRLFVIELLQMLHEQYGQRNSTSTTQSTTKPNESQRKDQMDKKEDRQSISMSLPMMNQLLEAIGADGDMRRLTDWIQNSFNLGTISEITTQFVVGKLASVNCAALLKPDDEDGLVPRFLLFNEHYVDVPYELPINPSPTECVEHAKFDALRKTIVIIHGYLGGYTITDGLTNIKNRILDINKHTNDIAMRSIAVARASNGTYLLGDDLQMKVRQQLYNVIIVDWFNGANPVPRSRYIRAAVNSQVVGRLIARFLSALVARCGTSAEHLQILSHSLGKSPFEIISTNLI